MVLLRFLVLVPVLLISLSIHECAHAWVAYKFGDPTAKNLGRVTLFPLNHLDVIGTILLVSSYFISGGRWFWGWGKPVPVNRSNFKDPRTADLLVSLAGPLSNFLVALLLGLFYKMGLAEFLPKQVGAIVYLGVILNASLAVFNLLPVYPLDGSHIIGNILPPAMSRRYWELMALPFVPIILMVMVISGTFDPFLGFMHHIVMALALGR